MPTLEIPGPAAIVGSFVILHFPGVVVIFIAWAVRQDMDLVRKDYYEDEIRFQESIESLDGRVPFTPKSRSPTTPPGRLLVLRCRRLMEARERPGAFAFTAPPTRDWTTT